MLPAPDDLKYWYKCICNRGLRFNISTRACDGKLLLINELKFSVYKIVIHNYIIIMRLVILKISTNAEQIHALRIQNVTM